MEHMDITWAVAAAVFVVAEVASTAFVAIYLAVGAAAAALVAWLGGSVTWQVVAFVATSIVLMVLTRPFLKRLLESPDVPTNVNRIVGRGGVVTIPVDNFANTGQIRVGSEYWTARLPDERAGERIDADVQVAIVAVEGVTARVVPRTAAD